MNMKFMAKTVLVLSLLGTVSFADMGHGKNTNHNMNQSNQQSQHMMNETKQPSNQMMNQPKEDDDSGMMMKKSGNKPSKMPCGAGKCGAGKCGTSK